MQTLALIGRRILYAALLLLAVIVLNFTLIRLAPGDIVQTIAGQMGGMNEELMLELRHSFQLDKSIPEQLLIYIGKVAHGDLGYSYFFNQPVLDLILGRVGPTVLLVFSSLVLSVVAGTLLGTLASRRLYGPFSHAVTVVTLIGWASCCSSPSRGCSRSSRCPACSPWGLRAVSGPARWTSGGISPCPCSPCPSSTSPNTPCSPAR